MAIVVAHLTPMVFEIFLNEGRNFSSVTENLCNTDCIKFLAQYLVDHWAEILQSVRSI